MKKLYTIFLGESLWENVIDDMNSTEKWAFGGMIWNSKTKAESCVRSLKRYDFETPTKKFKILQLKKLSTGKIS